MNNDFTELVSTDEASNSIMNGLNNSKSNIFASFDPQTPEDKKMLYNMTTDSDTKAFMDNNGKVISIRDCVVIPTTITNEKGKTDIVPRSVVATTDGEIYSASSWGLYRALARISAIYGGLHFDDGLDVEIKVVKTKKGKTVNLVIA